MQSPVTHPISGCARPGDVSAFCWRRHLVYPMLTAGMLWLVLVPGGADRALAGFWLAVQGGSWAFRHHFLTETLLHDGGRWLAASAWALVLLLALRQKPGARRSALRYLALSVLLSVSTVSGMKRLSSVECPWDDPSLGGIASARSAGHCFPAGHASAGYAWLALYFVAGSGHRRRLALLAGLGAGALFGLGQQMRGAHLASHDLATAAVCWIVALACMPLLKVGVRRAEDGA
jgi:membrane-associated PAP2 superfamily phosphatase